MATQIVCKYDVKPTGTQSLNQLVTALGNVPIDQNLLVFWGLRVASDATAVSGSVAERTITLSMVPSAVATFTNPTIGVGVYDAKDDTTKYSPLLTPGHILDSHGLDYIRPPYDTIVDPTGSGAVVNSTLGVYGTTVVNGGGGYSAQTTITATGGGIAPGAQQATFTPTIVANVITGVNIVSNGATNPAGYLYSQPPTLTVTDPGGGTGAIITARMGVNNLILVNGGVKYSGPTHSFTPWFKAMAPDTTAQGGPVASFMTQIIRNTMLSGVRALTPAVS